MRGLPSGAAGTRRSIDWRKEKPVDTRQFDRLMLMLEAILIVIDLAVFDKAKVGMLCYWSIVALYHLTDVILGRKGDG